MADLRAADRALRQDTAAGQPIAVIAGAGNLPLNFADALQRQGRSVFVVAVEGEADRDYSRFPHIRLPVGAAGRLLHSLRTHRCRDVMMAGTFRRPRFSEIEFDLGTLKLALSSLRRLRFGGDDAVIGRIVTIFEAEGFRIVGPREAVPELIAPVGPLTRKRPSDEEQGDISTGIAGIRQMGSLDVGQAVVVHSRRILAVEAAEGTSAMIGRCGWLRAEGRFNAALPSGVLVKMPKPGQELRIEMPVIGPDTMRLAAQAGLAGIAVEANGVLLADRAATIKTADEAGLFVFGFPSQ